MKDQKTLNDKFLIFFLSFFYTGYAPKAPGTFGSIAALPLLYLISLAQLKLAYVVIILIALIVITCIVTDKLQKKLALHDPQWIVIDEVYGMITTWLFIYPSLSINEAIAILVVFRVFDIIKIWPASFFDHLHHGSGTILDDIVSGIYAGLIVLTGKYFLTSITW